MRGARRPRRVLLALGFLSAFGPLALDFYLPGLPGLVADLGTTDSLGQATMSASMIGLAAGQLIVGPMSDRYGRRRPMLIGIAAFVATSVLCALAPGIEVLLVARLLQGIAGAAGIVVGRAIVRDLFQGADSARAFAVLGGIVATVPVIAPVLGGLLLGLVDWRGLFVGLAVIGAALLVLAWRTVPETLAVGDRHSGAVSAQLVQIGRSVRSLPFAIAALALAAAALALFSYLSMGPLVFQNELGLSPQQYALLIGGNAVGIVVGTQISRWLVNRVPVTGLAIGCVTIGAAGAGTFTLLAALGAGLPWLLLPLFVTILVHGAMLANVTALALEPVTRDLGAAAAVLGVAQFAVGAVVPPLVSLGGVSAVVMGVSMAAGMLIALLLLLLLRLRAPR